MREIGYHKREVALTRVSGEGEVENKGSRKGESRGKGPSQLKGIKPSRAK